MADALITNLTAGNPAQSGDEIPINRGGVDFKLTAGGIVSASISTVVSQIVSTSTAVSTVVSGSISTVTSSVVSASTAISTVDSNQSTSLSQISSSLSGAISSTSSLSTAVSTVISGSISTVTSSVTSFSTAVSTSVVASGLVQAGTTLGISTDVLLARDAAATLAQRNSTNAQTLRVYNTYTDASNYERGVFDWSTTANTLTIGAQAAGTGTQRGINLVTSATVLSLPATATGTSVFTGLLRANNIETSAVAGYYSWLNRSAMQSSADGVIWLSNYAGTDFARLAFGGTTSSFPALKRSTTTIQVRLADDSAYAGLTGNGILNAGTAGMGYATGAGGTVTQATSRTTGVTLNTPTGAITLVSAVGSATAASFTVTNSAVAATDVIHLSQKSGTDLYTTLAVTNVAAGSFQITFATSGGTTTEQPVFNFTVIKGITS